ncbi:MAG: sulfotransferase, partial [Micromonosporaceae bacterium]
HHGYRDRGHYIDYLEPLASLFGRDRIHVVDSAMFFTAPKRVYSDVLQFLGLPDLGSPAFEQHNARPRSPMSNSLRRRLEEHFRPYDERLETWLGHCPSWRQ